MFEKNIGMKIGLPLALVTILCFQLNFGLAQPASLEIKVTNIKSQKGLIRIGLFTKEKDFLKNTEIGKVVQPTGSEITVVFENLEPGDYALSIVHDENENGKLDSNSLGIPKEGFAFGNNAVGSFGPPSFEKAKVKMEGKDLMCVITMKYM
jgi:uncharacterized protein (DUF2141 family)